MGLLMQHTVEKMRALYPLSEDTVRELLACVEPCRFPKKHLLVEAGRSSRSAYFIERGITRSFWLVDGEEITTSFASEGSLVFSMDELYYGKASEEYVETLEETEAFRIGLDDLLRLFHTNLELANWGRIIHQNEYRRLRRSHKERLTLSAGERYEAFLKQFPDVVQRVQLGYVASYLGVTLPTLSRLRSKKNARPFK